jgi:alkylhydroperoxidase family enzyme
VIIWDPSRADDALWADLHAHFTEPELVELGRLTAIFASGQRWIHTLEIAHGEDDADSVTGYSAEAARAFGRNAGPAISPVLAASRAARPGPDVRPDQAVAEDKLSQVASFEAAYETSPLFTERERVALRYVDAIIWDPSQADDALWADLHAHFSEPQIVELGRVTSMLAGGSRWARTLDIADGEDEMDSATWSRREAPTTGAGPAPG